SVAADRISPVTTLFQVSTYKFGDLDWRSRREKRYDRAVGIESKIEEQLLGRFHRPTCWRLDWCPVNAVKPNRGTLSGSSERETSEHKRNDWAVMSGACNHTSNENSNQFLDLSREMSIFWA